MWEMPQGVGNGSGLAIIGAQIAGTPDRSKN
jgi:hypothetical protein